LLPYGDALTGWRNPRVIGGIVLGAALLLCFAFVETRVSNPMFQLDLFRIRPFGAGNLAGWLAGIARGGVQLMLVIRLQGVWLPLHGDPFADTPLWAGIYMLPMMIGYLIGPLSGYLSDRYGAPVCHRGHGAGDRRFRVAGAIAPPISNICPSRPSF
jgi:hypothetical protein